MHCSRNLTLGELLQGPNAPFDYRSPSHIEKGPAFESPKVSFYREAKDRRLLCRTHVTRSQLP